MTAVDRPWWTDIPGLLPVQPRWEPPAGSLRAEHGAALRESLRDRADVRPGEEPASEEER